MENKFRNEMEIELAGVKILLRPTMENIAAMEQTVGPCAYLGWKYSRGIRVENGQVDRNSMVSIEAIKALPPLSEAAKIIYFNQAAVKPEDPTMKKYSMEEIWDLVMQEGSAVSRMVMGYLAKITAGSKAVESKEIELTAAEKKN